MRTAASLLVALLLSSVAAAATPTQQQAPLTFEHDVRPILKAHCFECHGEGEQLEGGLDLRLRRLMVDGGDSGASIEPGKPADSYLMARLESQEMPPGETKLTDEEMETIARWIEQGATTARSEPDELPDGVYFTEEERNWWSFQPIASPAVPKVKAADRVRTPIDAFLLARQQEAGLTMPPEADRYTLIRRATFDLLGLPPQPEDVEQFVNDKSPDAYGQLIDRLLASPHYGERWGRHWLDVVGYADSEGYTANDVVRQDAYLYRDYVIRSLNEDKPLDQFIREQLAGDEMLTPPYTNLTPDEAEKLIATGFLRMAPDGTGQAGVEEEVARNQVIADALQIVGGSLLGLTVQCAQCHNHRYDPIPHEDYFRLRAIFEPAFDWKNWRTPARRRVSLYTDEDRKVAAAIEAEAKKVDAQRDKLAARLIDETLEAELALLPEEVREPLRAAYKTEAKKRTPEQTKLLARYPKVMKISTGSLYLYDREIRGAASKLDTQRTRLEEEYVAVAFTASMQEADVPKESRPLLRAAAKLPASKRTAEQKQLVEEYGEAIVTLANLAQFAPERAAELAEMKQRAADLRASERAPQLEKLRDQAAEIRARKPKEEFVRALTEVPGKIPATVLFDRGDWQQPKQELEPGELTILASTVKEPIPSDDPELSTSGRRLAYAEHLTSGQHPLVPRVLVNRVWMHHFGQGLVRTPSDFGALGERPSHPELLDWLASQLVERGWSLKELHRLIMTSSAYRQQVKSVTAADDPDPDNRLLAGMPLRRLEAEVLRDAVLAVSGKLNAEQFGPPVPVMADRVGQFVIGQENLNAGRPGSMVDLGDEVYRRSVYVQVRRSRPLAALETFDQPDMAPNCEQRAASTNAPQALMLLNNVAIVSQAQFIAHRVRGEAKADLRSQAELAWRLIYTRPPEKAQLDAALAFIEQQRAYFVEHPESLKAAVAAVAEDLDKPPAPDADSLALASFCQTLLASNGFLYVD